MNDSRTQPPPPDETAEVGAQSHEPDPSDGAGGTGAGNAETAPPPPPPRPLLRRDHHKHVAGVAGGLADFVGVDAAVIRVAFAILTIFGGVGLPLYLVAWAALPSPSMPRSHVERWFSDTPNPATVIAVAIGFILILAAISEAPGGGTSAGWGLVLLFGGWLLFRADSRNRTATTGPSTAPVYGPGSAGTGGPAGAGSQGTAWHGAGGSGHATAEMAPVPPWVAPPPRPRSILGRATIGTALAAVGVAAAFQQLGMLSLQPIQFVALALTVIGLGLVVGAWVGRAYGLIGAGFLLIPILVVMSLGPLPLRSGIGEAAYSPGSIEHLPPTYALGIGELDVDLSEVSFTGTTTQLDVTVGVGQTTITVPSDVTVAVEAEMRAGVMELFDERTIGRPFPAPVTAVDEGRADGGRLQLRIDNGVGELIVRRAGEEL